MSRDEGARKELVGATDAEIVDATNHAEPMVLRALLHQLLGDDEVVDMDLEPVGVGIFERMAPAREADVQMLRDKTVAFLKSYRDSGADELSIGPAERLHESFRLLLGEDISTDDAAFAVEELALDPWIRSVDASALVESGALEEFSIVVIGAGMAGLNAAVQLKRSGITFSVIEKNDGVGGTWHENHYPGARVDSSSRNYTHLFGVDYPYPWAFCPSGENKEYFDWVADTFELREHIEFGTEVRSLRWHEDRNQWEITTDDGSRSRTRWADVVFTAVGFLNRPMVPAFPGIDEFEGESWHTARWPQGVDLSDKRVIVIGTGSTGYQLVPELAKLAKHVTVLQRTPAWLVNVPGYLQPSPAQVSWLDRNLPFYTNFMRYRASRASLKLQKIAEIDPDFQDPDACNEINRRTREMCLSFLREKIADDDLLARLTPGHPYGASRPVVVDPEYSFLDAVQRDDVTLVSAGVNRITRTGIETTLGTHVDVDVIVFATGFHATEYLFPMEIVGRDGRTIEEMWSEDGARAYLGLMVPGFPNLFTIYGPNTNGGLAPASMGEMATRYALSRIVDMRAAEHDSVEVSTSGYDRWNAFIDARNLRKVWSDPRAHNYYWTEHGRSATMNPLVPTEMWLALKEVVEHELVYR